MAVNDIAVQEFVNAIKEPPQDTNKTYNATVSHIDEEGVVWVNIHGSDKETPTASTSTEVKRGDNVTVQWRNNKLYIGGNYSNPSAGMETVQPSVDYVSELIDKDVTVNSINAATGYIKDLTAEHITADDIQAGTGYIKELRADNITAEDISASSGYIKDLKADNIEADDIIADHGTIGSLDVNYAKVNAANIDSAAIRNAWVDKIMVQTGLLAYSSQIYTLDAIEVNAANITAGTLDVNRLIVTVGEGSSAQKYLVNIDPSTGTPSYEKLDGNIVEPRTITADKIVAGAITTNEITANNLQGTSGWINLHEGKFFYGDGASFASATNAISWNGSKLQIKADEFLLSTGQTIQDSIESVENWFYSVPPTTSNPPANSWTTTNLKEQHLRDIYFDTTSGKSYRWAKEGSTYKWVEIEDVELSALAKDLHDNYPPYSEFTVQPDQIAIEVGKKVGTNEVIAKINASTEGVQIQAAKVDIAGAAVFNNYSTTTEMNNAIGDAVDGIEVGGRNLLLDTDASSLTKVNASANRYISNTSVTGYTATFEAMSGLPTNNKYALRISQTDNFTYDHFLTFYSGQGVPLIRGNEYTMSVWCKKVSGSNLKLPLELGATSYLVSSFYDVPNDNEWHRYSWTFTAPTGDNYYYANTSNTRIYCGSIKNATSAYEVLFCGWKLESGNKATDWTLAPEDVQGEIDAKKSVHTLMSSSGGSTYANILAWTAEGRANTSWGIDTTATPIDNIKVGDTVRVAYKVTDMNNAYVYVIGTFERSSGSAVYLTMHGLDTTIIDGGNILTNSIGANQIAANSIGAKHLTISDNTNLATANEMYESSLPPLSGGPVIDGGYLVKKSETGTFLFVTDYQPSSFKTNDELYYEFYGKAAVAGNVALTIWGYDGTPPTHSNVISNGGGTISLTTSEAFYSGTITLARTEWPTKTQYLLGFNDARSTKSQIYIRKLIIRRKNGGELIVDGSITSDHISANKISASKIKVDEINIGAAQITSGTIATARIPNLSADKITSGTINIGRIPDDALNSKIEVGGTNLLKEIGALINPTAYNFARISLTEKLVAGQTYTFQVWGVYFSNTPNTSNTVGVYWGGGNISLGTISSFSNGYGYVTFTPTAANVAHADASHYYFNLYNTVPSSSKTARGITITQWKLEKGNKPTAWTPSPTDKEGKENILRGTDKMLNGNGYYTTGTFRASGGTISHGNFTNGSIISGATGYAIVTNSGSSATTVGMAQDIIPAKYATKGLPYTLSGWVKGNSTAVGTMVYMQPLWKSSTQKMEPQSTPTAYRVALDTQWQYVSLTGTLIGDQVTDVISGGYVYALSMPVGGELHVAGLKLEQSTGASAWSCGTEARADTYVTDIDENGIYISPAGQSPTSSAAGNSVKINANGTYVYKSNYLKAKYEDTITLYGGSNASGANPKTEVSSTEVAMYGADGNKRVSISSGSGVVLGLSNKGHVTITDATVSLYDTNNKERTQVNTSGLLVKNAAGNTKASIYDTITLYAGAGTYPLAQISGSAIKMAQSANNYINVNSSGLQIYQNNSNVANFGASTIELGKNSNTSIIKFCNGLGTIQKTQKRWDEETPYQDFLTLQSASVSLETPSTASYYGTIAVYSGTASNQGGVIDITANGQDDEYARLYVGAYYNDNSDANEAIISMDADWIELERGSIYHLSYNLPGKHSQTANAIWHKNDAGSYKLCQPNSSSRRYKEDIKPVENDRLDPHRLYDIPVMQFKFKEGYFEQDDPYEQDRKDVIGFIAEDVYEHYPQAAIMIDEEAENWDERYIIPPMLKLIQEQNDRITELERRLS